ncbi:MAG: 4-carboxy-4-hydroxy-2-oxoadipate aldolase/oxaloacetate decarboxylase [Thermomicrobiales bacterium]
MTANTWCLTQFERVSAGDIEAARTLPAASIYEANGRCGAIDPEIRQMTPGVKLCGNAITVRCQSGDNLTLHAAVAYASPGDVLVADVGDFADAGHWGEILTVAAQSRQIAGLVINGGVRDIAALGARKFPVFARAVSMKATTKQIRGLINHPVRCGGVDINPGDLIVADEDGVVVVAHDAIRDVLSRANDRETAEASLMESLRGGAVTLDLLNLRSIMEEAGT